VATCSLGRGSESAVFLGVREGTAGLGDAIEDAQGHPSWAVLRSEEDEDEDGDSGKAMESAKPSSGAGGADGLGDKDEDEGEYGELPADPMDFEGALRSD